MPAIRSRAEIPRFAIAWACTDDRLKAIAPYYGANPRPLSTVARSCPVVGSYPEKDFTARSARNKDLPRNPPFLLQRSKPGLRPRSLPRLLAKRTLAFFGEYLA
jgi:hypothetical protein